MEYGATLKASTSSGAISNVANIPGSTDMCASGTRHDDEKSKRYASFAPRKWWFISYRTWFSKSMDSFLREDAELVHETGGRGSNKRNDRGWSLTRVLFAKNHFGSLAISTTLHHEPPSLQRSKKELKLN